MRLAGWDKTGPWIPAYAGMTGRGGNSASVFGCKNSFVSGGRLVEFIVAVNQSNPIAGVAKVVGHALLPRSFM